MRGRPSRKPCDKFRLLASLKGNQGAGGTATRGQAHLLRVELGFQFKPASDTEPCVATPSAAARRVPHCRLQFLTRKCMGSTTSPTPTATSSYCRAGKPLRPRRHRLPRGQAQKAA